MGVVTEEVKSKILLALQEPGHVVSAIAKLYGVSNWSIYQLRKNHVPSHITPGDNEESFVELRVQEDVPQASIASAPRPVFMEKATFTSQGLFLTLEGKVLGNDIRGILKFLEGRC
jgi:hypothetical protein